MERTPSYHADWIYKLEPKIRWELYWMQQKIMEPYIKKDHNLLELGVGSGFCSNYLKSKGYKIETIDIDEEKDPDILCNILDWMPTKKYNGFLSFQVFEHLKFEDFEDIINKLANLKIEYLYISVPYNSMSKKKLVMGDLFLPKIGKKNLYITWPYKKSIPIRCETHMWELDDSAISKDKYYKVYSDNDYKKIHSQKIYYAQYDVFKIKNG